MRNLISVVLLVAVPAAFAGYDKTTWGMPLRKVQALYPGGVAHLEQNGETTYGVVRPVGAIITAAIVFAFDHETGLKAVSIVFPVPGSEVNLEKGTYLKATREQNEQAANILRLQLREKYGEPTRSDADAEDWFMAGDHVSLSLPRPGHPEVALTYLPRDGARSTKGL